MIRFSCFLLFLQHQLNGKVTENKLPDFIFIYSDDQRKDTLGANEYSLVLTPMLERMVKESVNLVHEIEKYIRNRKHANEFSVGQSIDFLTTAVKRINLFFISPYTKSSHEHYTYILNPDILILYLLILKKI